MIADCDVGVFAHLNVTLGAEDEEAAIAPCAEAIRREPIETNVA